MKELFAEIEKLVPTCGDWCSIKKACALAASIIALRPAVTVEIGVFSGASFLPMALAHQFIGHGMAYAIDPWSKQASLEGMDAENAKWWAKVDHELVYQKFVAKCDELELKEFAKIIRAKSNEVDPPKNICILHIDGNHGEQAIRDAERFAPNVIVGGLVWMDDMNWTGGSVAMAADKLVAMGFEKLYEQDTGAVFQRTSK